MSREGLRGPRTLPVAQSRATRLPYSQRLDPLHEVPWHEATLATRWLAAEDPVAPRPALHVGPASVRAVAALAQFHQLTTFQLGALLALTPNAARHALDALFECGVVQRGTPGWAAPRNGPRPSGGAGPLWRLDRRSRQLPEWLGHLDDPEWALATGCLDLTQGTSGSLNAGSLRHNLVTAELALRALEACPAVVGAWGEPLASIGQLLGEAQERYGDRELRANIADAVLVLRDGALVVVEAVGQKNLNARRLAAKTAAWAAVAARSTLDLRVLCVDVSARSRPETFRRRVWRGVEEVDHLLTRTADRRRARERVYAVSARDWWPGPRRLSEGFLELEAWRVSDERFHPLAPVDTPLRRDSEAVWNVLAGLATPDWINEDPRPLALPEAA